MDTILTMAERIHSRTFDLLYAFVARRERKLSCPSIWPATNYKFVRSGLVYDKIPVGFCLARSTAALEPDDVDVMGEAFFALEQWKGVVLWVWATTDSTQTGLDSWKSFQKSIGLSERKLENILLDLQEEAEKRGIV
jgi:hypothetical protein